MTIHATTVDRRFTLTLGCPDETGIVARIAGFLADAGAWITEAAYHSDADTNWFFTRQTVRADSLNCGIGELRRRFEALAASQFHPDTEWRLTDSAAPKKAVVLVSKENHCLIDLLGRARRGEFPSEITAVIGNHAALGELVKRFDVPFHLVPFNEASGGKTQAFDKVSSLIEEYAPDAIVFARFMQILPEHLCNRWGSRTINIHHSFLPSFVGARPYHQAYARGVKLIGATCHYVTSELDAGPIIEQDVIRVDHSASVADMVRLGRDIESLVLARGVRWHLEDRVLVHGGKTVVFN